MMRRLFYLVAIFPLLIAGCGKKNDMVLDKDDMAELMADIHIAEAVVDLNHNIFNDDSSKMLLKQSIYAAHGVTAAQVDSSYKWYGHHIEDYMEVYDLTLKILDKRQEELISASNRQIAIAGDSVDVWPMSSRFEFSRRSPSRLITFSVPADSNWQNNDVFTLRFNMATTRNPVIARMVVEYADGTSYYNLSAGKSKGIGEVSIRVDSTLSPTRIAGYIIARPEKEEIVRIDSISLVRLRHHLSKKYFSQRPFNYGIKPKPRIEKVDSSEVANDSASVSATTEPIPVHRPSDRDYPRHNHHGSEGTVRTADQGANNRQSMQTKGASSQTVPASTGGGGSAAQESLRKRDELLRSRKK